MKDKVGNEKIKMGTLVYIKSSVTSPRKLFVPEHNTDGSKNPQFDTFKYKIYHPDFPHESTADQFFDPVQWESYFQLGQFIGTDVLGAPKTPGEYRRGDHDVTIDQLVTLFDEHTPIFKEGESLENLIDVSAVPVPQQLPKREMVEEAMPESGAAEAETQGINEEAIMQEMQFKI